VFAKAALLARLPSVLINGLNNLNKQAPD
jgi:hypothetical protein